MHWRAKLFAPWTLVEPVPRSFGFVPDTKSIVRSVVLPHVILLPADSATELGCHSFANSVSISPSSVPEYAEIKEATSHPGPARYA